MTFPPGVRDIFATYGAVMATIQVLLLAAAFYYFIRGTR